MEAVPLARLAAPVVGVVGARVDLAVRSHLVPAASKVVEQSVEPTRPLPQREFGAVLCAVQRDAPARELR